MIVDIFDYVFNTSTVETIERVENGSRINFVSGRVLEIPDCYPDDISYAVYRTAREFIEKENTPVITIQGEVTNYPVT